MNARTTRTSRTSSIAKGGEPSPFDDQDHVMVDVETMGRKPGCAVLSIGATRFDPSLGLPSVKALESRKRFYVAINNFDSSNLGFASDPDTMRWWKRQEIWPQLSMEIMNSETSVAQASELFKSFLCPPKGSGKDLRLWANSPTFDIAILRTLFDRVKVDFPVTYRQEMDFRTLMELAYPVRSDRPERTEVIDGLSAHNALGDAASQANLLLGAMQRLGISEASSSSQIGAEQIDPGRGPGGKHLMLEVKTLGKSRNSALLSIGAVIFDPTGRTSPEKDPSNRFYLPINSFDMGNYGFGSDPETVRWWKSQPIWSELSIETVRSGVTVMRALKQLSDFIERKQPDKVWANSPSFDIEMLRDAYDAIRQPFPIHYRKEMDYRTVMDTVFPRRESRPEPDHGDTFPPHHALGDALNQSNTLMKALNRLTLDRDALARPEQFQTEAQTSTSQRKAVRPP